MQKLIYIAICKEDIEPVLSAFTEQDLLTELDKYNGVPECSKIIKNISPDYGEFEVNFLREITYESIYQDEIFFDTYSIWVINII